MITWTAPCFINYRGIHRHQDTTRTVESCHGWIISRRAAGSAVLCGCGCAARLSAVTVGCCLMWLVGEKAPTQSVSLLNRINANSVTFKRKGQNHALFCSYVYTVCTVKSGWKYEDFRIRMNGTSIRNLLPTNHGSKTTWRWDAVRKFLSLRRLLYAWVILWLETWCT